MARGFIVVLYPVLIVGLRGFNYYAANKLFLDVSRLRLEKSQKSIPTGKLKYQAVKHFKYWLVHECG